MFTEALEKCVGNGAVLVVQAGGSGDRKARKSLFFSLFLTVLHETHHTNLFQTLEICVLKLALFKLLALFIFTDLKEVKLLISVCFITSSNILTGSLITYKREVYKGLTPFPDKPVSNVLI